MTSNLFHWGLIRASHLPPLHFRAADAAITPKADKLQLSGAALGMAVDSEPLNPEPLNG